MSVRKKKSTAKALDNRGWRRGQKGAGTRTTKRGPDKAPRAPELTEDALAIQNRRTQVTVLRLQGHTQTEIGQLLGVDQSTISRDLKAIDEDLKAQARENLETIKARELAKIEHREREAWKAWDRSQKDKTSIAVENEGLEGSDGATTAVVTTKVKTTKKTEAQAGDPRFLEQVGDCGKARRQLLGLDAPKKITLTDEQAAAKLSEALGVPPEALKGADR